MRTLLIAIVLLLVGIAGLGFYRGWFLFSTSSTDQGNSATISVDKDKILEDEQKAKDRMQGLGQDAEEETGDRTGEVQKQERRP